MMGGRTKSKQTGHSNNEVRSDPDGLGFEACDIEAVLAFRDSFPEALGETANEVVGAILFVCLPNGPPEPTGAGEVSIL
jgi:hypothetical protein